MISELSNMLRANAKHANKEKLCEAVLYEEKETVCMQNLTPLKRHRESWFDKICKIILIAFVCL